MAAAPVVSLVIPVYNEGPFLVDVIAQVTIAISSVESDYEIIIVDDGSEDNSWEVICHLTKEKRFRKVRGIGLTRNFGKEAALSAGLDAARGQAVILMDGDLEHPPELIPIMFRAWRKKKGDIIEAIKTRRSDGVFRSFRSNSFYFLLKLVSGIDLKNTTDFKLLDRSVVNAWKGMQERNLFFRGMINWLGFSRFRIDFAVPPRIGGKTRWSVWKLVSLALLGVTAYTTYPLRLMTFSGFFFLVFAIILSLQTLYQKFFGTGDGGFATVIILLLVTGSAIMIGMGIIGEYLARIYEELKGRPRYVVARKIKNRGI